MCFIKYWYHSIEWEIFYDTQWYLDGPESLGIPEISFKVTPDFFAACTWKGLQERQNSDND